MREKSSASWMEACCLNISLGGVYLAASLGSVMALCSRPRLWEGIDWFGRCCCCCWREEEEEEDKGSEEKEEEVEVASGVAVAVAAAEEEGVVGVSPGWGRSIAKNGEKGKGKKEKWRKGIKRKEKKKGRVGGRE